MTKEEAIKIMQTERACVLKATSTFAPCNRECYSCDLYLDRLEIAGAYTAAIEALQERPKGRWIELPCEVGSTVWCIYENKVHKAVACKVSVAKGLYNFNLTRIEAEFDIIDSFYNDGRTQKMAIYAIYLENVFLTEEEAEKALADMRESE